MHESDLLNKKQTLSTITLLHYPQQHIDSAMFGSRFVQFSHVSNNQFVLNELC